MTMIKTSYQPELCLVKGMRLIMEYIENDIKKGVKLHILKTDKFKTNLIAVFLTTGIQKETVTKNALISAVLRRGTNTMKTQEEISKKLEELYGASFDCGVDKTGDNQVLKFYIESVNDKFLPQQGENMLKSSIDNLFEIVFNPLIENKGFKQEYVEQEKQNMKQRIEGKIDNKARYALDRCIEEWYKDKAFGLYKFGYVEDLKEINEENLYEQYKTLINTCKVDIWISGDIQPKEKNLAYENQYIQKLTEREAKYQTQNEKNERNIGEIIEEKDVTQGKLVIGLSVNSENEEEKYTALVYNHILGGSANSKIFQNVREKANLAYAASSNYFRYKDNIFINCGIEIENYHKAVELIKAQIEDMKNGKFTEEELENAKKSIIAMIHTIDDEQDTGIMYYFGQELSNNKNSLEDYVKKIENVKKEDIVKIASRVQINIIYFLRNKSKS